MKGTGQLSEKGKQSTWFHAPSTQPAQAARQRLGSCGGMRASGEAAAGRCPKGCSVGTAASRGDMKYLSLLMPSSKTFWHFPCAPVTFHLDCSCNFRLVRY